MTKQQLTRFAELVALAKSNKPMTRREFIEMQVLSGLQQMSNFKSK